MTTYRLIQTAEEWSSINSRNCEETEYFESVRAANGIATIYQDPIRNNFLWCAPNGDQFFMHPLDIIPEDRL